MKKKGLVLALASSASLFTVGCQNSVSKDNKSFIKSSPSEDNSLSTIITQEILDAAQRYQYDFNPTKVVIKEKETYDYSNKDLNDLESGEKRDNHYLVFRFEGKYDEGYPTDNAVKTFGNMFLWDDGLFFAQLGDNEVKGYWYNSSLSSQNNIKDCLVLISNQENYEKNIASQSSEYSYQYFLEMYLPFSWGHRTIRMSGYYFYPDIAISFFDYLEHGKNVNYKIGDYFSTSNHIVIHIIKSLGFFPVLDEKDISWTIPEDMLNQKREFYKTGDYSVKAEYKNLVTYLRIVVD